MTRTLAVNESFRACNDLVVRLVDRDGKILYQAPVFKEDDIMIKIMRKDKYKGCE